MVQRDIHIQDLEDPRGIREPLDQQDKRVQSALKDLKDPRGIEEPLALREELDQKDKRERDFKKDHGK